MITPIPGLEQRVPPDNTSFPEGKKPALRGEDLFWMNLLARKQMTEVGYPFRPVPSQPFRILWSIMLVPVWFLRQYVHLRRRTGGSWIRYVWNWLRPNRSE